MQTTQGRRPLPAIHVHRTLPPGAVRRSLRTPTRADHGAARAGATSEPTAPVHPAPGPTRTADGPRAGGIRVPVGPRPTAAARTPGPGARRRVPVGAVLAAGTAVLVAVVLGVVGLDGGDDGTAPGDTRAVPAPRAAAVPPLVLYGTGARPPTGPLTVAMPLPAGLPGGRVNRLADGPAAEAEVSRLAAALGLDGRPEHTAAGWTVRTPDATLQVADSPGRPWTLRTAAAEPPLPGRAAEVPIATPGGGVPDAARAVLAALGLDRAEIRYAASGGSLDVVAAPAVGDVPTTGMETRLRYAGAARLAGGAGWLAPPLLGGPAYPLVGAEQALAELPHGAGRPLEVVAARPGLALRRDLSGRELLVPAWFYSLRGGSALTAPALDPAYVDETAPAPPEPTR